MSVFSIGISGLNAAQYGLTTTGHNISNVNTDGYHRQSIVQETNGGVGTGTGFLGQGTKVATVKRSYDQLLETQLTSAQTQAAQISNYLDNINQIDNVLADSTAGLSPALQDFFSAVGDVSSNPGDVSSRQSLVSSANTLATRFQTLAGQFDNVRQATNDGVRSTITTINSLSKQVAALNDQIINLSSSSGQPPNDLLDQRDNLVSQLNAQVGTRVLIQSDGSVNVAVGNGQQIVVGNQSFQLTPVNAVDDPTRLDVALSYGGSSVTIPSGSITGGALGGYLDFRSTSLDTAQNSLGRIALGVAQTLNSQHALGQDLSGNLGSTIFTVSTPATIANALNTGTAVINTTIANAQNLSTSDYRLDFNSPNYVLTRLSDNTQTAITAAQITAGFTVDGLTLKLASGTPTAADSFTIQPTRGVAANFAVSSNLTANTVAAAAPIRANAPLTNLGTGKISPGSVNAVTDKVTLNFTSATTFDVTDSTTGATLATAQAYTAGSNISFNGWTTQISGTPVTGDAFTVDAAVTSKTLSGVGSTSTIAEAAVAVTPNANLKQTVTITFTTPTTYTVTGTGVPAATTGTYNATNGAAISFNGWSAKITGSPQSGDVFTIGANTSGVSDNRNVLALASLQTLKTLSGGTASYQTSYSQLVSFVGNKANETQVMSKAQDSLVATTKATQQSLSGVNLDEEAANLLRYQQAYQASGKLIQIASSLFASILAIGN